MKLDMQGTGEGEATRTDGQSKAGRRRKERERAEIQKMEREEIYVNIHHWDIITHHLLQAIIINSSLSPW